MLRRLLMTTAATTLFAAGAYAQQPADQQQPVDQQQQADQQQTQNNELQIDTLQTDQGAGGAAPGQAGGQEVVVNSGDTIVIQPTGEGTFSLNFRFDQAGTIGAAGQQQQQQQQTGQVGTADQAGAVQREGMQQVEPAQLSVENLTGSTVYGVNDENIGNVSDVLLSAEGEVDAVIVDVGGFLGIGTHPVALGTDNLQFMVDEGDNWYVFTPFTQEQLEAHPAYDADTYQDQRDQQRLVVQQ